MKDIFDIKSTGKASCRCSCNDTQCSCKTKKTTKAAKTTVKAVVDVGWGNSLYIRGEGCGLSWDKGVLLVNTKGNTWIWETTKLEETSFKLLINDEQWCEGDNFVVKSGKTRIVKPVF